MKDKCIKAVIEAAGRTLHAAEIQGIVDRITEAKQQLARKDRNAYLAMPEDMRLQEAAKIASEQLVYEAQKERQRIALKIIKHDAIENYITQQSAVGMNPMDSLRRVVAFVADTKSNFQSIETRAGAIAQDYIRQLVGTFESVMPKAFGLFSNTEGVKALTYELFGQDSSKVVGKEAAMAAKGAAKLWNETAEMMRQNFNSAGGQIGKLENWRMPQNHSQKFVADAGQEQWIRDVYPKLDRKEYVNENGSYMDDAQIMDFLKHAWETIATGGANKIEPGKQTGIGMKANRHAEERSIHFKDAESYLDYKAKYSGKDTYSTMMGHIHSLSSDIAALEVLGPNPDLMYNYFLQKHIKEESLANPLKSEKIANEAQYLQGLYEFTTGKTKPIANKAIADGFDTLRNWLVATRLGSAAITSIADNATMQLTASVNNMSGMKLLRNQLSTLNIANREELQIARRAGLSLQTFTGEVNRWATDNLAASFSKKMAALTIRLSGLNAMTEGRRRAFGVTMFGSIGNVVRKSTDFESMNLQDRKILESKGVTDVNLQTWKKAQLEDWGNGNDTMLTPESIYRISDEELRALGNPSVLRRDAALKLLGMVDEEINMAIIEPGAIDRYRAGGRFQKGTIDGEIARSFFLFKGMPIAQLSRHWARGMGQGSAGGKAAYLAKFVAGTTLLGAAAMQINNLVSGRDPQDMTSPKFWAGAFAKGGSLGIYGDFLFNTNTQYGSSALGVLAGPVAGYAEDLIGLTHGNLMKYAKGEKTHAGADAIRMLKNNIPLQNLWYTKAATDRLIFNQLQEMVSPGYMRRVEQRAQRDFKQSYYWSPRDIKESRAPDFKKAFNQ